MALERMCVRCRDRVTKSPKHPCCHTCYRTGASTSCRREREIMGIYIAARPATLQDTGLRIDDEFAELVHPDGTRQFPVPRHIVAEFWLEPEPEQPGLLRVMRVGPTKENHAG